MNFRPCNITPRAAGFIPRGAPIVIGALQRIGTPRKLKHAAREIGKEKEDKIEALHAQKDAQIEALKKRNGQIEERLAALGRIVGQLARQQEGGTR